jgi:uncharacterized protein GlcG (DUF336 family)
VHLAYKDAWRIVTGAHGHARDHGLAITVAVVDTAGILIALGRMDGAFALSPQIAEAKAVGAAVWRQDGRSLAEFQEARPAFFAAVSSLARLPLMPADGALVIRLGDEALGAIGVSGASGEEDRACAEAGLRAFTLP